MAERQNYSTGSDLEKKIGFSRAVRVDNKIYVSGTAPLAEDGSTWEPGNLYQQTLQCINISLDAIEELGGSMDTVIRTRIMLKDISRWEEAAEAHGDFFRKTGPACTFVEVKGFIGKDWLVETELEALVRST